MKYTCATGGEELSIVVNDPMPLAVFYRFGKLWHRPCYSGTFPRPGLLIPETILSGPVYEYGGWLFEVHYYCGPMLLNRRTGEERVSVPAAFWKAWEAFEQLSDSEKARYLVER